MQLKLLFWLLLALSGASAQAVPLTWNLSGVTFNEGAVATGSFVFDADTQTYLSWNITTTQTVNLAANGFTSLNGRTYTTNSFTDASTSYYLNPSAMGIKADASTNTFFGLIFRSPLTGAGGVIDVRGGSEKSFFNTRSIVAGTVSAAVPEPQALVLLLAGLGVVGLMRSGRGKA